MELSVMALPSSSNAPVSCTADAGIAVNAASGSTNAAIAANRFIPILINILLETSRIASSQTCRSRRAGRRQRRVGGALAISPSPAASLIRVALWLWLTCPSRHHSLTTRSEVGLGLRPVPGLEGHNRNQRQPRTPSPKSLLPEMDRPPRKRGVRPAARRSGTVPRRGLCPTGAANLTSQLATFIVV